MSHVGHTVYICSGRALRASVHHTIRIVLKDLVLLSLGHDQSNSICVSTKTVYRRNGDAGPALSLRTIDGLCTGIVQHRGVDDVGKDHGPSVPSAEYGS